jgi:hypothetical protein
MIQFTDQDIYDEALASLLFFEEDFDEAEGINALIAGFVVVSSLPANSSRKSTPAELQEKARQERETVAKLPPVWTQNVGPVEQLIEQEPEWHVMGWSRETIANAWGMAGMVLMYHTHGELRVVLATEALVQACETVCPRAAEGYIPDYEAELSNVTETGLKFVLNSHGYEFICGLASDSICD